MNCYAYIFARGGSKGLPRKNIKLLAGKPLIAYSIEVAKQVSEIKEVFVSTDDDEIADVARRYGAVVIKRPEELARDDSPEWLAWRHAIEWTRENFGEVTEFVSLPATSPLRNKFDIESAIQKRVCSGADICISVTPASRSPYFNMVRLDDSGRAELVIPPAENVQRRQDAPAVFDITTVVYVSTQDFIMNSYGIFSGRVVAVEIPKERAVDIDDIYDFMLAEAILATEE